MNESVKNLDLQLINACGRLDYAEVLRLLDAGADPNAVDEKEWNSPLSALVYYSALIDEPGNLSTSEHFEKIAELLLKRGADVNLVFKADDGCIGTALLFAQYGLPDVVSFLLARNADPDIVNEEDETVLDAIEFCLWADYEDMWRDKSDYWVCEAEIRKILLDHGAHRARTLKRMKNAKRWNPVMRNIYFACWHLQAEQLDRILNENPIRLQQWAYSALFREVIMAAQEFMQRYFVDDVNGYEKRLIATLEVLLRHGCKDDDALYFSVKNGYVETTRYLLAHGADPKKCDWGYWKEANSEQHHYYTLADKMLHWRCRWKKETALALMEMFPQS